MNPSLIKKLWIKTMFWHSLVACHKCILVRLISVDMINSWLCFMEKMKGVCFYKLRICFFFRSDNICKRFKAVHRNAIYLCHVFVAPKYQIDEAWVRRKNVIWKKKEKKHCLDTWIAFNCLMSFSRGFWTFPRSIQHNEI